MFQNRLKWCLKELEKNYIIPENVDIGVALLAAHNPTAVSILIIINNLFTAKYILIPFKRFLIYFGD